MRVLITGAAGFLGSHAVRHFLVKTDWDIVALVSFKHKGTSARLRSAIQDPYEHEMWEPGMFEERVTVIHHDLAGPIDPVTAKEIGDVDFIINYASESHVDRSITDPVPFVRNNVDVMLNMLEYARTLDGLRAFVQISTDEVYGPAPVGTAHKEWEAVLPSNPYSASKAAQEAIAVSYWRTYGVPVIITNCMNLIGEMQDSEKFVPMVIKKILAGEEIPLHARKREDILEARFLNVQSTLEWEYGSRFYLHARNLADAVLFILKEGFTPHGYALATYAEGADLPDKYHIVGEREVDNYEMAQMIYRAMGGAAYCDFMPRAVDFHSQRPGHDMRYALDGTKLESLGWKRPISLEESIDRTVRWFLEHPEWL